MKLVNINIHLIVGVLAVGLTAFTKYEPKGRRITVPNCYRNLVVAYNIPNDDCGFSTFTLQPGIQCSDGVTSQLNRGVLSIVASSYNASLICESTDTFFCCAQLEIDDTPCLNPPPGIPVQPTLTFKDFNGVSRVNKAKIHAIYCKTLNN